MIARLSGAAARGLLVALMIATPALVLPGVASDTAQITVYIACIAGLFTGLEYASASPGIVEFRDAAPLNRTRFIALLVTVLCLSLVFRGEMHQNEITRALTAIGTIVGSAIDIPFSPIRPVFLMLPENTNPQLIDLVRAAAGIAFLTTGAGVAVFLFLVRVMGWPARGGVFNIWVNLPLFDPSGGGDVVSRLKRDGRVNLVLGIFLPFLIPAVVKATADLLNPNMLYSPQTLIWTLTAWAFLPASMMMRGIAMLRIAALICDQRKRAAALSDSNLQPV